MPTPKKPASVWAQLSRPHHDYWHLTAFVSVVFFAMVVCYFFGISMWHYVTVDQWGSGAEIVAAAAKNTATPTAAPRLLDGVLVDIGQERSVPYGVMIENLLGVRPQSGLSQAAVVYEALAEGGATRFLALFDPAVDVPELMPVRSARPYYVEWVAEYGAMYAHAGGSPQALTDIGKTTVINNCDALLRDSRYFWRDRTKYAPHNLVTSAKNMVYALRDKDLLDKEATFQSWLFKNDALLANRGADAKRVSFNFSYGKTFKVDYQYSQEKNVYLRFNADQPHLDKNTNEQIAIKNVIVQLVQQPTLAGEKGRLNIKVTGEGKAWIYRDGQVIEGTWKKSSTTDRTFFYDAQGQEMELNRGNTWIHVVPKDKEVIYQ
jgi:hypothetical protein